ITEHGLRVSKLVILFIRSSEANEWLCEHCGSYSTSSDISESEICCSLCGLRFNTKELKFHILLNMEN
ncbi:hypothetical protein L195_g047443, partial [Trifolium pratense]